MTAARRPTAAELMRGETTPKTPAPKVSPAPEAKVSAEAKIQPVRVTLNIPPELYRQLRKWTDTAADEIGVPCVSQQDALRAMLQAVTLDKSIGLVVIDQLRRENGL